MDHDNFWASPAAPPQQGVSVPASRTSPYGPPPQGPQLAPQRVYPAGPPPPRKGGISQRAIFCIVGAVCVGLVVMGAAIAVIVDRVAAFGDQHIPLTNQQGQAITAGRPWGAPCQTVHVAVLGAPDDIYADISSVMGTASAAGVPIVVDRDIPHAPHDGATIQWQGPGSAPGTFADYHEELDWYAPEAPRGGPVSLKSITATWHGEVFAQDADPNLVARRYARHDVFLIFGMRQSLNDMRTSEGRVAEENAEFTPKDIAAIRKNAGCA